MNMAHLLLFHVEMKWFLDEMVDSTFLTKETLLFLEDKSRLH